MYAATLAEEEIERLRQCTCRGRPFGGEEFVVKMEEAFGRSWRSGRENWQYRRRMTQGQIGNVPQQNLDASRVSLSLSTPIDPIDQSVPIDPYRRGLS